MSRRVRPRLWILLHIGIWVHPLRIGLHAIGRHEPPAHWILPPRIIVIQSRYRVGELAGVALVGAQTALEVALIAVGAVKLLALDAACTEAQHHAAQRVGQIIRRARAAAPADQVAGDALILALVLIPAAARERAFLQAKGIRRERRGSGAGRAFEHAFAASIVDVVLLPAIARAGLHQLVERVVGERLAHAVNPPTTGVSPRSPHKNAQAATQPAALKVYRRDPPCPATDYPASSRAKTRSPRQATRHH